MARLLLYLLSTVAPSARFPVLWARLNRLGHARHFATSTLRAAWSKPARADISGRLSAALDRFAEADAAVNAAMQARLSAAGRTARVVARAQLGAATRRTEGALSHAEAWLRRYWSDPAEARLVGAVAAATLAALLAGALAQVPGSQRGPAEQPTRLAAASSSNEAALVPPEAAGEAGTSAPTPPDEPAPPPAPVAAPGAAPTPATSPPAPDAWSAPVRGALPIGKGMWLYVPEQVEGGDPHAIVAKAQAIGLTHVYVRTGSSKMGFYAQDFLDRLLPVAHENGIRVYGWDFPYFYSWSDDVYRALEAITYTTPDGHRIDGFSADIETEAEGTRISAHHAHEYGAALRRLAGPDYPLIATVPRPTNGMVKRGFPYAELAPHFDAFAPMVYWMQRDPAAEAVTAMDYLSQFGRPVMPVGQAYDGGLDGGHPGVPSAEAIIRFMQAADARGAPAVSFWSWQHADEQAWHAIHIAGEFRLAAGTPEQLPRGMVVAYQTALAQYGFDVGRTGVWDDATTAAVRAYQQVLGLPISGIIDEATLAAILRPFRPPTAYGT